MTSRRRFMKSILAAGVAPYVVTAAGVLMPVRELSRPVRIHRGKGEVVMSIRFRPGVAGAPIREHSHDGKIWVPDSGHERLVEALLKAHPGALLVGGTIHVTTAAWADDSPIGVNGLLQET